MSTDDDGPKSISRSTKKRKESASSGAHDVYVCKQGPDHRKLPRGGRQGVQITKTATQGSNRGPDHRKLPRRGSKRGPDHRTCHTGVQMGPHHRNCHTGGGGAWFSCRFALLRLFSPFFWAAYEAEGRKVKRRRWTNTMSPESDASGSLTFGALIHVCRTLNHPHKVLRQQAWG